MKNLLKLTDAKTNEIILVGSSKIIEVKKIVLTELDGRKINCTVVRSVGAMVTTNYVMETPEQIHKQDCE